MLISGFGLAQSFPVTGQLASTAFPVCGVDTFRQSVVPIGSTASLQVPGCGGYPDTNPFWYSFTCYAGGTLGFLVTPNDLNDDYDWMLFDITGRNASDVYTDPSLVVIGNWAGTYGATGAETGGSSFTECASYPPDNISSYSIMPTLVLGHKYLLLISHYTNSQSGYTLTFGGGTASITDPNLPHFLSVTPACDRKSLTVVFSKQVQCTSLVSDGSDISIASNPVSVTGASGFNCNDQFDMDSARVFLSAELVPGVYSLVAHTGTDGNTLLDDCHNQLPAGETITFTVFPPNPTPLDSLVPPGCSPTIIQLVFSDSMKCSSIAADGSDLMI